MRLISLQNLTAFLCITGSLLMMESDRKEADVLPSHSRRRPVQRAATPFWAGGPTSKLEAQMHFYMQPTARKVSQRD